jgi:hypothetical protein
MPFYRREPAGGVAVDRRATEQNRKTPALGDRGLPSKVEAIFEKFNSREQN